MNAHMRGARCFCNLCHHETVGMPAMVEHINSEHEHHPDAQRWPDGELVIDASDSVDVLLHNGLLSEGGETP